MAKTKNGRAKKSKGCGNLIKKGTKGEAAQYLTRAQVLKRLQLPLSEFRKLCILKGIYPRDPKKKSGGKDKSYYHLKDIRFLQHEPLLDKFRNLTTFMKKYKRFVGRKEKESAKRYEQVSKPFMSLNHLVKERYPKFDDALRDLDDGLSLCALFDTLPVDKRKEIPAIAIQESARVMSELQLYVIRQRRLRKVFASIKGYYYQIDINGIPVTWLCPHRFTQNFPGEVDFKVLLTFLDLHRTVLKFVNYRLYSQSGAKYPPAADEKAKKFTGKTASLRVEDFDSSAGARLDEAKAKQVDEFDSEEAKAIQARAKAESAKENVFKGLVVFVGREVPFDPVYFCLRACGAEVGWEREGAPFGEDCERVTHHIIDRPMEQVKRREGREYVQPQWVFDSLNEGRKLPVSEYIPGQPPPPHLSPFVDNEQEGYVPERRSQLMALAQEEPEEEEPVVDADDAEVEDPEAQRQAEVEAELQGVPSSEKVVTKTISKKGKQAALAKEEEERQKAMMSKKHKRMMLRIDQRAKTKSDKVEKLEQKAKRKAAK